VKLKPPDLWPPVGLSREEHEATKTLHVMVFSLRYFVETWAAALELFRFGKSRPEYVKRDLARQWQWITIHECAMQIAFLLEALTIIRAHRLRPCQTVRLHFDRGSMRRAFGLFEEYFPNFEEVRHAVAHRGSVSFSPEKHAPDGLFGIARITDADRFETTYEGVQYHLDITAETLGRMADVVTTFWAAFAPVEKVFDRLGRSD